MTVGRVLGLLAARHSGLALSFSSHSREGTSESTQVLDASVSSSSAPEEEFGTLWQTHHQELFNRCVWMMGGNLSDAEEAYSLASLKAVENYARYAKGVRNPRAWLLRLVINTCISLLRSRQRELRLMKLSDDNDEDGELEAPVLDTPEDACVRQELARYLNQSIDALPLRLRLPVELRLVQGVDYTDIAEQLQITEENARKRVQHGRELLRLMLERYISSEHKR